MFDRQLSHALGWHMHQPPGNLKRLLDNQPAAAEQILRCYQQVARYAHKYADVAYLHVGFSGVLLEQLSDPKTIDAYRRLLDIPAMLNEYATADNIELIGMGYAHPIFPLIPARDWAAQLAAGQDIMRALFGRAAKGFWPPEMAFSQDMIGPLVNAGFEYVVIDSGQIQPQDAVNNPYRPYLACHEGVCITLVPREQTVSKAQQQGLDLKRFVQQYQLGAARYAPAPRLLTTWMAGEHIALVRENGAKADFFSDFFSPYMEHVRSGDFPIAPVSLTPYLRQCESKAEAGLPQSQAAAEWAGSESQRLALRILERVSAQYETLANCLGSAGNEPLARAKALILEAQASCFLRPSDDWIALMFERSDRAEQMLDALQASLPHNPSRLEGKSAQQRQTVKAAGKAKVSR
jgi:hypothetical protein